MTLFVVLLTFKAPRGLMLPAALLVFWLWAAVITELGYKELDCSEPFDTYRQTPTPTGQLLLETKNIVL